MNSRRLASCLEADEAVEGSSVTLISKWAEFHPFPMSHRHKDAVQDLIQTFADIFRRKRSTR